jgi:hypothetical protein
MNVVRMLLRIAISTLVALVPIGVSAQVAWSDQTTVTVLKEHPARSEDAPVELLALEPRGRNFEALCMITATGGQTIFNTSRGNELVEELIVPDARKCGADAVIIKSAEDQSWKPLRGGIDRGARAQAIAIRYLE